MSEEGTNAGEADGGSLLESPSEGGNNPLSTWKDSLPDDIKNDPSLQSFKDVDGLAKSYIHAQKMVGSEKVAVPRDDWADSDWSGHYDALGRPSSPDGYSTPPGIERDLADSKKALYDAGLSSRQADKVLSHIDELSSSLLEQDEADFAQNVASAREDLSREYGRDAPHKLDIAKGVLQKFGTPALIEDLADSGMANNIELIKALVGIGDLIIEDDIRGGRSTITMDTSNTALSEINVLKSDTDFMAQLGDRSAVGHKPALERWQHLHSVAFSESA